MRLFNEVHNIMQGLSASSYGWLDSSESGSGICEILRILTGIGPIITKNVVL